MSRLGCERDFPMTSVRLSVSALLVAAGTLMALQSPALAFFGRQFNERWCLQNNAAFGGWPDCAYRTYRECAAMQSGVGGLCMRNPAWATPPDRPRASRGTVGDYPR